MASLAVRGRSQRVRLGAGSGLSPLGVLNAVHFVSGLWAWLLFFRLLICFYDLLSSMVFPNSIPPYLFMMTLVPYSSIINRNK